MITSPRWDMTILGEVVDELIVHGDAATCRAGIREYVRDGPNIPVLAPIPGGEVPDR
ncbi:hypothetical protein GCM10022252_72280 [Streptosporangium oxazolinicum]|uniref:Uncharacterized protein n=1 Tax=Streptosporangium oxazolinicum TaxID=909287 RepID=A0ABP8BIR2_9ACTN